MKRTKSKFPLIFTGICIVLIILILTFFILQTTQTPHQTDTDQIDNNKIIVQNNIPTHKKLDQSDGTITIENDKQITEKEVFPKEQLPLQKKPTTTVNKETIIKTDLTADMAMNNLDDFFLYLDQQEYIQLLNLPQNSRNTFSTLVQKLIDNPPVVSGEADDLFTLLKNTAHFFRVLGENNIILLKEIFVHEADKIEILAQDLFIVLNFTEELSLHYNITTTETALYEYSSFLMNTMGGRLYLFRRDMEIRMLVSYYSILFVEQAEQKGLNNHGLDVKPFVTTLIKEIENHGQKLLMRDTYLERLYEIDQRTNR